MSEAGQMTPEQAMRAEAARQAALWRQRVEETVRLYPDLPPEPQFVMPSHPAGFDAARQAYVRDYLVWEQLVRRAPRTYRKREGG